MWDFEATLTLLGMVVVAAPVLLLACLGLPSLLDWKLGERTITRACQAATVAGLLAAISVLGLMLATDRRHVADRPGRLGRHPALPLLGEVRLRPAVGALRHPVVRAVRHDWGVRQPLLAPRARVQPLLRAVRRVPRGHGRDGAGGHDRDLVHRLGTGWAVVRTAGRVLPGAARAAPERAARLGRLPRVGRRPAAGRRGDAPSHGRRRFRSALGRGAVAGRTGSRFAESGASWWVSCC